MADGIGKEIPIMELVPGVPTPSDWVMYTDENFGTKRATFNDFTGNLTGNLTELVEQAEAAAAAAGDKMPSLTLTQLGSITAPIYKAAYVIDAGSEGNFAINNASPLAADGINVILDADGNKWLRDVSGVYPISKLGTVTQAKLATLISLFNGKFGCIMLDKSVNITSNLTIPSNVKIDWVSGCIFNISSNVTLTINSAIREGGQQLFSTTGTVAGSFRKINVKWFGVKGDGIVDDTAALNSCMVTINSLGGGDLTLHDAYKVVTLTAQKKVKLGGTGTIIGTGNSPMLQIFGAAKGDAWDFRVRNLTMQYPVLSPNNSSADAIQIKNVDRGTIAGVKFENCNSGVKFIATGVMQHTKQVKIFDNDFVNSNYNIIGEGTPDAPGTPNGDFVANIFELGDISIRGNNFYYATYTHVWMKGVDGLNLSKNWYFHKYDSPTKEYNIDLYNVTRVYITDEHAFEPGYESIRIGRFRHVTIANFEIAWPGQRSPSAAIKLYAKAGDTSLSNTQTKISNIQVSKPTKHGIEIGPYISGVAIDAPQFSDIGVPDQYLGNAADVTSIPHKTVYSDPLSACIRYTNGVHDSYNDYRASLNGKASIVENEFNSRHNAFDNDLPQARASNEYVKLPFTENLFLQSNNLADALWSKSGVTVEATTAGTGPFGGTAWKVIETAGTSEKVILAPTITKVEAEEDYTLSFYAKAVGRKHINVIITNSSFSATNRIVLDFNIETGKANWADTDNAGNFVLRYADIKRASNGWFKVQIITRILTGAANFKVGIYSNFENHKGLGSFAGDGATHYLLSHLHLVRAAGDSHYVETTTAAAARTLSRFSSNFANLDDSGAAATPWRNVYAQGTVYTNNIRGFSAGIGIQTNSGITGYYQNSSGLSFFQPGGTINNRGQQVQVTGLTLLDGETECTAKIKAATFEGTAIPEYADNAAAAAASLAVNRFYQTPTGAIHIRK